MRHKDADSFQRINMDIKDLYIDGIPMIQKNPTAEYEWFVLSLFLV